jgi:hypothetical protein
MWRKGAAGASASLCGRSRAMQAAQDPAGTDRPFVNFWQDDGLKPAMRTA